MAQMMQLNNSVVACNNTIFMPNNVVCYLSESDREITVNGR